MFVMRYMKEIVEDKELQFAAKVRISLFLGFLINFRDTWFFRILVKICDLQKTFGYFSVDAQVELGLY